MLTRRHFLITGASAGLLAGFAVPAIAGGTLPAVKVYKDPNCGCCGEWVNHMRMAGFAVSVENSDDIAQIKERLGVPQHLFSCHTAQVDGYIIEGHVPATAVKRLIEEKPKAKGLAVPGMPIGSPGMEVPGEEPQVYDVVLFGDESEHSFARYKGAEPA